MSRTHSSLHAGPCRRCPRCRCAARRGVRWNDSLEAWRLGPARRLDLHRTPPSPGNHLLRLLRLEDLPLSPDPQIQQHRRKHPLVVPFFQQTPDAQRQLFQGSCQRQRLNANGQQTRNRAPVSPTSASADLTTCEDASSPLCTPPEISQNTPIHTLAEHDARRRIQVAELQYVTSLHPRPEHAPRLLTSTATGIYGQWYAHASDQHSRLRRTH